MKNNSHEPDRFPDAVQQAFAAYPRITASDDFNQRVMERVLAGPPASRFDLFCDRMDKIFARPVLKLVGAASLGGILGLGFILVLFWTGGGSMPASSPTLASPSTFAHQSGDDVSMEERMVMAPSSVFWMSRELWDEKQWRVLTPEQRKLNDVNKSGERSSACLVCVSSV